MTLPLTLVIVGGGAAGFFGAIACAQGNPLNRVILLEKARQVLSKVKVSGGGRCNVTHHCFDPKTLITFYPRGSKELLGAFHHFQPKDTIQWFEERGVLLKTEQDGRMFPVTDSSETIINCLMSQAKQVGVDLRTECGVESIVRHDGGFKLLLSKGEEVICDRLLIATGSSSKGYQWIESLGHHIVPQVPSLFTFNVPTSPLLELSGASVPLVKVKIQGTSLEQMGPLLLTHWGFSGPAILKLSAWGARQLHEMQYKAILLINWLPQMTQEALRSSLLQMKQLSPGKLIGNESPFDLPKKLWKKLTERAGIVPDTRWCVLSKMHLNALLQELSAGSYKIDGKSTYKEEFVTCGGVNLSEVDFKSMQSKICPGLYFAGEVLDIDGVTGGFNFQSAWTTSWIAGKAMQSQK